ncbi:MAG TPA: protein-glutamine glutaminase family protein [Flavipsychrobacter sp.]|nr:protein-glutamine glutaminase family protein [Flavipsychrobacter sp.]
MKKQPTKPTINNTIKFTVVLYVLAVVGILVIINACKKNSVQSPTPGSATTSNKLDAGIVTIADMHKTADGSATIVLLNQRQQVFTISDTKNISSLEKAFNAHQPIKLTIDPHAATIMQVNEPSAAETDAFNKSQKILNNSGTSYSLDNIDPKSLDLIGAKIVPSDTTGRLTNMIPNIAAAEQIFDFCAQQSCTLSNPLYQDTICIPFQYVIDGCYARAHEMCWIIENKFHYHTQKVFSYANKGADVLSVLGSKWGGCCIYWWFHVVPLISVNTPQGPKAYVIDPGMFDQPVLLSTWLAAQQNKTCSNDAHVSKISIQPFAAYTPTDYTGNNYDTDSSFAATDATFYWYSTLKTCP